MIIATILVVLSALFTPVVPAFAQDTGVTITNVSPTQTTFNIASGEITFSASASSASAPVTLEIAGYTEDAYPDGTPTFLSGCAAYQAKANGTYATDTTYTATLPNGHYYLLITAFTSGTDRVTQGHAFTVCDSQVPDFESSYDMITLGRQIRPMDSNPPAEWVDEENRSPVDESTYRTTTTNIHFHSSVRSYMYFPFYNEIWVYPVKNFPNGAPAYVLYTSVFSSPMFTATIDGTTSLNAGPYVVKYYAYNTSNYNFELQDFRHICVDGIVGSGNNPATVFARSPGSTNIPAPSGGPSAPDPVNLADGSDANLAGVDLSSYNPIGPSASFERAYYSRQACAGYGSPGLPVGWVHNYDFVIQGTSAGSWNSLELYYPNGQIDELKPQLDNGAPTGDFEHRDGTGYLVTGASSTPDGRWSSIEITDKQQMKMTFAYLGSTSGVDIYKLSSISNSLDQTLTFNWDTSRKLTSITNGTTTLLTFSYDAYGYLATVSDNNDRKVCYTCEPLYWITPRCLLTVSQIGATGDTPPTHVTYAYTEYNNMPLLSTVTVPSPTGSGNSTATTYYTGHWVNATVDANGNRQEYSYTTDSTGYATSTLVTTKKPNGTVVHRYTQKFDNQRDAGIIDDNQHSTSITYGDSINYNKPTEVTAKDGKHVDFTYDQYGNLMTFTDARGVVTTNTYAYTNFTMGRLVESQTGSLTPTTISYNEPEGFIDTMTTPKPGSTTGETVTTSFTYDTLGNVLTIVAPGKDELSSITTTMNYTTDGGYSQSAALGQPLTVTDDLSHVTHYRYDGRGFPVTITNANGNETEISYNLAGQVTEVTLPATGQTGNGNSHSVKSYLYPGGPCQSSISYDEDDTQVSATTTSYGAEGEVLGQTGDQQTATYSYDPLYRVATLTDGNSHTTSYTYDLIGRLTQVTMPGNETLQYTAFDTADRPTQRTDGNSVITNYSYNDDAGLLTAISYPATTSKNVSFSYDGYGRRSQMTDSTGVQTYSYDDGSWLASVTTTYTGLDAQTISYQYNPNGSRDQMTTPAGSFSYSYDAVGQPISLTDPDDMTSSWTYRADGVLLSQILGNGAETTYTPNALGQITALTNEAPDSSTLSSFTNISYDGLGNKLSILATLTNLAAFSGTTTFSYDTKSQLLSEASTRGDDYTFSNVYDSASNPTTYRGDTATYNANNQRTGADFSYDSNGNTTLNHDTAAIYDAENRLTQYDTLSADYNGDGLRAWKDTGEQRTYYLYDGVEPICELVSSGSSLTVTAVNSFGAHGLLSRTEPGVRTLWYQFDSEGNVTQRLDNDGDVLTTDLYDAWGNLLDGGDNTDPFGYKAHAGYYTDHETGLVLCTFRYYDPQTGRWLTRDPIGYLGGLNLYGYCGNNSENGIDSSGFCNDNPSGAFGPTMLPFVLPKGYGGGFHFWNPKTGSPGKLNWGRPNSGTVFGISDGGSYDSYRLDYGTGGPIKDPAWHWNVTKNNNPYGVKNHQLIGEGGWGDGARGAFLNNAGKAAKIGGRVLLVAGAAVDVYDTVTSDDPLRTGAVHAGGWAGAWAVGQAGGSVGATIGTMICPGIGTAIGGVVGGIVGGVVGYNAGETAVQNILD